MANFQCVYTYPYGMLVAPWWGRCGRLSRATVALNLPRVAADLGGGGWELECGVWNGRRGRGIDSDALQVGVTEIYPADGSPLPGVECDGLLTRGGD